MGRRGGGGIHPFRNLKRYMPKGLYGRSLVIVVAPMVLLQAVVAFVFMERHWERVTLRLSSTMAQEISALIELRELSDEDVAVQVGQGMGLSVVFEAGSLPPVRPKAFFSLLDRELGRELAQRIERPFWWDTVSDGDSVDIRILVDDRVMRLRVPRSRVYATNSHIFIVWMVVAAVILLAVAVVFLRNQIRPIQEMARVAESFGKGREVADFRPSGATEVRGAAVALLEMKRRIDRHIRQRTDMLAGVSHDLRTPLTRFRLHLAVLEDGEDIRALRRDVEEMEHMLESYLNFARGAGDEPMSQVLVGPLLAEVCADAERRGLRDVSVSAVAGDPQILARAHALKRCLTNLVDNACIHGKRVVLGAERTASGIDITVDDDGPGIPSDRHEEAFRPFHRLGQAHGGEPPGAGLGLALARDVARSHGGDVVLSRSALGGLRACVHLPE